jgi:hypothetical protein
VANQEKKERLVSLAFPDQQAEMDSQAAEVFLDLLAHKAILERMESKESLGHLGPREPKDPREIWDL